MKQSITILATVAVALLCGCNVEIQPTVPGNINIEPVITRATETDFEQGDKIGVTIIRNGADYATNECMTYENDVFKSNLAWYTSGEQNSEFIAYYPYAAAGVAKFSVATDQSGEGYGASDLMCAVKKDVTPQAVVAMVFKHMLTRIVVSIDNQSGARIQSVTLKNAVVDADVNLQEQKCTPVPDAAPKDIIAHKVTSDVKYTAVVIPQTVTFSAAIQVENGALLTKKLSEVTLKAGGQYTISMTVLPTDVNMSISGQIEAWSDEGTIPEKQVTFNEYDKYFEYDGVNYNTVVLSNGTKWMAENLRYVPEGCTVGVPGEEGVGIFYPYTINGSATEAAKDDETVKRLGLLYSGDVLFSTALTRENVHDFAGQRGICPPGWHIPTRAEYLALCGNSNKDDSGTETGNVIDATALFYDAAYSAGKVKKFNDAGWNLVFSGSVVNGAYNKTVITADKCIYEDWVGSCAMNYYWSSTGYLGTSATSKPQMFALMTTFTSSNNEGKVSLSYCNTTNAAPLRCVKDVK